jgi:hypothetical protein
MLDRGDRKVNPEKKNLINIHFAIIGIFTIYAISIEPYMWRIFNYISIIPIVGTNKLLAI